VKKRILQVSRAIALLAFGMPAWAATVTVFAAASLTDSLREIATAYEKQTGDRIVFNLAGSGTLTRQIEEGAPADLFFSADEARMDNLEKRGFLVRETRRSRLSNSLVIVVPSDSPLGIISAKDLAEPRVKRVALGDPRTVPVGSYTREYLERLKLWSAVRPKGVPCESARAVLAAVESGNVEAGVVYKTDAAPSKQVRVAVEVPINEGPKISCPMALLRDSRQPEVAKKFLDYLRSDAAGEVFKRHGFIVLNSGKAP